MSAHPSSYKPAARASSTSAPGSPIRVQGTSSSSKPKSPAIKAASPKLASTSSPARPKSSDSRVRKPNPKSRNASAGPRNTGPSKKIYRIGVLGGSFDPITDAHLTSAAAVVQTGYADEVWLLPCGARPDKPSLKTAVIHRLTMCHLAVGYKFDNNFPISVSDFEANATEYVPTYLVWKELTRRANERDENTGRLKYLQSVSPFLRRRCSKLKEHSGGGGSRNISGEVDHPADGGGKDEAGDIMEFTSLVDQYDEVDIFMIIGSDLLATIPKWKFAKEVMEEVPFLVYARDGYELPRRLSRQSLGEDEDDEHSGSSAGSSNQAPAPKRATIIKAPAGMQLSTSNASSTELRNRIRLYGVNENGGKNDLNCIAGLTPLPVQHYIIRENLYRD